MNQRRSATLTGVSAILLTLGSVCAAAAPPPEPMTFNRDVAPILRRRCGVCHRPGGSAPFTLLTYTAARRHASQIAEVTRRRIMPPWRFRPGSDEFVGKVPLSEKEIDTLEAWVVGGTREGDLQDLSPAVESSSPSAPDLIVRPDAAYELPASGTDIFQTFVIRNPLRVARYVKSVEFIPSATGVIHHADILLDRTTRSRRLAGGSTPTEGMLPRSAQSPPGYLLGWSPGQGDAQLPGDLAWRLDPGVDIVVQLHLLPRGRNEAVSFSLGLRFADGPPAHAPSTLRLSRQDIELTPGETDHDVTDSYTLPVPVDVLSLKPHAHTRARQMVAAAELPDGTTRSLLVIDDWDFRWQQVYVFAKPVFLPKGARLTMRYTYDNSDRNPRAASVDRRVHWGPNAADEMGDLWIQVLPHSDAELDALNSDFHLKALADNAVGYETLLRTGTNSAVLIEDLAATYAELGLYDRAVPHLQALIRLNPGSAVAHYNLGVALARAGHAADAVTEYRASISIDAGPSAPHFNLGTALQRLGRADEALAEFRLALVREPALAAAHNNIGSILMGRMEWDQAVAHFTAALALDPRMPDAAYNMGLALAALGQWNEARRYLRKALDMRPGWPDALQELSWLLSTGPDTDQSSAIEAVALATQAMRVRQGDTHTTDVLAAAHAAAGDFDEAVRLLSDAIGRERDADVRAMLNARMGLYVTRTRFRQP
jgi:tetratricopeptide (TPR) repeat protein